MSITHFSHNVARKLGYYVYLYSDPETGKVFYVGKGKGNRGLAHLHGSHNEEHAKIIRKLKRKGIAPHVEILIHGLRTEEIAHEVETAVIDVIGLNQLANNVRGRGSRRHGRMTLEQVVGLYQGKRATIKEPAILIRINQLYRFSMSETELYDATRTSWKVGHKRNRAQYAIAVYQGIVREVYQISQWLPAGSTFLANKPLGERRAGRWEFVGTVAPDNIRRKYINRSVAGYIKQGGQNPIHYVNC